MLAMTSGEVIELIRKHDHHSKFNPMPVRDKHKKGTSLVSEVGKATGEETSSPSQDMTMEPKQPAITNRSRRRIFLLTETHAFAWQLTAAAPGPEEWGAPVF